MPKYMVQLQKAILASVEVEVENVADASDAAMEMVYADEVSWDGDVKITTTGVYNGDGGKL